MSRIRLTPNEQQEEFLTIKPPPQAIRDWRSQYENGAKLGIYMSQDAYKGINQHLGSEMSLEVGGMLIGNAFLNHSLEYYIVIDAFLEARHIEHSSVRLTFTSDSLTDMHERLEASYPDKQIVGWYHSHPALSIFLSSYDVWLHKNFFPQPWHVALVVDPLAKQGGFFRYSTSNPPYINPLAYYGFYEIGDNDSVVDWNNLEASAIEPMDNLSQEG